MNIGPIEIALVLVIALLVFGPKRLPEMGRMLGRTVREFKHAAETAKADLGLNEVAADVKSIKDIGTDLKSSMTVDLNAADEPAEAGPATDAAAGAAVAAASAASGAEIPAAGPAEPAEAPAETAPPQPRSLADQWASLSKAPDGVAPDGVAPDGVAPEPAAADVPAPEGPAAEAADAVTADAVTADAAAADETPAV